MQMFFDFDWDANKARVGCAEARSASFAHAANCATDAPRTSAHPTALATTVFRDPPAITIFDDEHSNDEDRWVTLGHAENGHLLVVIHKAKEVSETELHIRIISARRAEREEIRNYEQTPR